MSDADPARIASVLIVGGGTAGWMAAAALAKHFHGSGLVITLVESDEIGTIGVGEATIPTIRRFIARLGLSDETVMRATGATAKLGILFEDWHRKGEGFIHPFGLYGEDYGELGFHHLWLQRRRGGDERPINDYSFGAQLAERGRMAIPPRDTPRTPFAVFDWALHLDAAAFARLLRDYAVNSGVKRVEGRIISVEADAGMVRSVTLADGNTLAADLFIDCSGFRGLMIEKALGVGFEDWSEWLPCDAAVAVQSEWKAGDPPPFTRAKACDYGWQWRIPLRHRAGNGYVYSTRHLSADEATAALLADLPGKPLRDPLSIPFRSGRRTRAWQGNTVALGLASGFLEPLESTSIALIETGIERLKELFPTRDLDPALADEFNDATAREMERVRDFIILHYKLTRRDDTPFWVHCRDMAVPPTLERKLALWDARGEFVRYRWEMFHPASWLAMYAGFQRIPRSLHPALATVPAGLTGEGLDRIRAVIDRQVAASPSHQAFLDKVHG
ncbi:tryptophan 7-halogenase [Sphingomonas ginkgonis]|uniref:Tryptophan 7-halogenase n=1 Tax=Sphingomonas ginkgonis TaxID=2315330 RepID=A0A429VBL6_9SPHN|nr:tryptophan halogenase family protein [Sphingomonas ginkgonis]RST31380.1 tryptophan 7-halogenase [Sphingomonas ginkgonis]